MSSLNPTVQITMRQKHCAKRLVSKGICLPVFTVYDA
jgi:hypothetical protein